jgi:hypothetical protein
LGSACGLSSCHTFTLLCCGLKIDVVSAILKQLGSHMPLVPNNIAKILKKRCSSSLLTPRRFLCSPRICLPRRSLHKICFPLDFGWVQGLSCRFQVNHTIRRSCIAIKCTCFCYWGIVLRWGLSWAGDRASGHQSAITHTVICSRTKARKFFGKPTWVPMSSAHAKLACRTSSRSPTSW